MKRMANLSAALLAISLFLVGCQQQPSQPVDMSEAMKPPPRPAELDRLNSFVGSWEGTMEMKDQSGNVTKGTVKSTSTWEADKRAVLERIEGSMNNERMSGVGLWTYDAKTKQYKAFWTDSHGNESHSTSTYDEATKTWHLKSSGRNPQKGMKMTEEATLRFTDANTAEWQSTMRVGEAVMEMKGVNKRKQ